MTEHHAAGDGPPPRTAVILAAGCGRRLGRRGEMIPKGFLRLGERSLVEESLERLVAAGVRTVVIVTGHHAEHYESLARAWPGVVETVRNEHYASSGSLASLDRALSVVSEDLLLLESDLVYESRALAALLDQPSPDAVLVSGPTGAGDEVYVEAADGHLVDLAKNRMHLGPSVVGEFVGISRVSSALGRRLREVIAAQGERARVLEYERALVAAARLRPVAVRVVDDLAWSEIDDETQLLRARATIYPRIRQSDPGAPRRSPLE